MVDHPREYKWSSYSFNGAGQLNSLISPHALYSNLGVDLKKRLRAYRGLFHNELRNREINAIRSATNGNFVLGSDKFRREIETALGKRTSPGKPGRAPSKFV